MYLKKFFTFISCKEVAIFEKKSSLSMTKLCVTAKSRRKSHSIATKINNCKQ